MLPDMKTYLLTIVMLLALFQLTPVRAQTPASPDSEVESIRKEMQQMRVDYEQRIQALEARLQKVEATAVTNAVTNVVVIVSTNPAPTMMERGMAYANQQFAGDAEPRGT